MAKIAVGKSRVLNKITRYNYDKKNHYAYKYPKPKN